MDECEALSAGKELNKLEEEWYSVSVKCVAIDGRARALHSFCFQLL